MSLAEHPDRIRWNGKYGPGYTASFVPHPLAAEALAMGLPDGPVADLACGPSGSALLAAGGGRKVTAVDISRRSRCGCSTARRGAAASAT